jgi:two-component system, cell cycle sensor histidine kinase and response regulator CckA
MAERPNLAELRAEVAALRARVAELERAQEHRLAPEAERMLALLETFIAASPVGLAFLDPQLRYLRVNATLAALNGIPPEAHLGRTVAELFPKLAESAVPILRGVLESGEPRHEVHVGRRRYGVERSWYTSYYPVRTADGAVLGVGVLVVEQTERTAIEQVLRRSEARFQAFMDHSPASAWITDANGTMLYTNATYHRMFKLPTHELIGKSVFELYPAEIAEQLLANIREVARTGAPIETVEVGPRPDGSIGEFLVYKFPLEHDSSVFEIGGVAVDITERRRAEQRLAQREERFRALVQHASDLIIVLDGRGAIVEVSPAVTTTLGYAPEELVGTSARDLIHPEDVQAGEQAFRSVLDQPNAPYRATLRTRRAAGGWAWLDAVGVNLLLHPAVEGIVINARDVTERRQLEAQFLQAQKMEIVGRLAGGIAHDFNNILTGIIGYTTLALDGMPRGGLRRDIYEVQQSAMRAANLTQQLLAFARKQVIDPAVLDLNALIDEVAGLLRRLIGEDVALVTQLAPDLWPIRADGGQIEQVLVNLAVNARDAMPEGGRLLIETGNITLESALAEQHLGLAPGAYVLLTVSDTGVGMSDDVRAHAFEPFWTTKELGRGTGLGLATCYGIVRQHGGHIWVESEPGRGASFKVYLPRAELPVAPLRAAMAGEAPRGSETILLVEDERAVLELAARVLRAHGYTVLEASNGEVALGVLDQLAPHGVDLVVTDMVMPKLGGPALVARLRERGPGVKVLFTSGYSAGETRYHGVHGEGVPFLQKPFSPQVLVRKVREVLDAPAGLIENA